MEKIELKSVIGKYSYEELDESFRKLVDQAKNATQQSYAPYSQFRVGAAVLLADGQVVIGANQENAAYPSGLCAERTALFSANVQHRDTPVCAIAVAARNADGFLPVPVTPCGACRQVMLEVEHRYGRPITIILYGTEAIYVIDSVTDILPLEFELEGLLTGHRMKEHH